MPGPLSNDLRERVIAHHEKHGSGRTELSKLFGIGSATAYRWIRRNRETGSVSPSPMGTGHAPLLLPDDKLEALKTLVAQNADSTLAELCAAWKSEHGADMSVMTMSRALARAGLTLKKSRTVRRSASGQT